MTEKRGVPMLDRWAQDGIDSVKIIKKPTKKK